MHEFLHRLRKMEYMVDTCPVVHPVMVAEASAVGNVLLELGRLCTRCRCYLSIHAWPFLPSFAEKFNEPSCRFLIQSYIVDYTRPTPVKSYTLPTLEGKRKIM